MYLTENLFAHWLIWCVTTIGGAIGLSTGKTLASDNRDVNWKEYQLVVASNLTSLFEQTELGLGHGPIPNSSRVERKLKSGKMASTGDIWLQWFSCCFHQPQSPRRRRHHQRLRIDRSMIGNPTNFVHTGHIGSNDVELSTNHLSAIQNQMQSKGGYEMNSLRLQACWWATPSVNLLYFSL